MVFVRVLAGSLSCLSVYVNHGLVLIFVSPSILMSLMSVLSYVPGCLKAGWMGVEILNEIIAEA